MRPVVAVSTLPKTHRFLAEHGLAEWCIPEAEPQRLKSVLRNMHNRRNELSHHLSTLRASLHAEALKYGETARALLLDAAQAKSLSNGRWINKVRQALELGLYR
jgi:hypothetical protein